MATMRDNQQEGYLCDPPLLTSADYQLLLSAGAAIGTEVLIESGSPGWWGVKVKCGTPAQVYVYGTTRRTAKQFRFLEDAIGHAIGAFPSDAVLRVRTRQGLVLTARSAT